MTLATTAQAGQSHYSAEVKGAADQAKRSRGWWFDCRLLESKDPSREAALQEEKKKVPVTFCRSELGARLAQAATAAAAA
jgi:hypothetical protein